jgi:hypothetical protein
MDNFRKWLIQKLGGYTEMKGGISGFSSEYWKAENVSHTLYIDPKHFTDAAKDDIEREMATQIGLELLKRDLLSFSTHGNIFLDHGDQRIWCMINVLKHKTRDPGMRPPHLKKGDDTMNECNYNPC